jgi:DNA polymerase-3 subunit gamma/tau
VDVTNLNLARKWRSKNFDQIVGQDLSIKMLKNSLYLGHYFPVYLFAGMRGCGKTTTARVFAAAVNCQALPEFQKNPRTQSIPCLECASCTAMMQGKHPDFFEIDAASHTGVDTIRAIIDASQLLPLMGSKKIYLIDEAHMLSKASFNALLKILEEPPRSVLFILATTDDQKIIDTVKSRCFQLFFRSIEHASLLQHLVHICQEEKISFESQALELVIEQSQGSARDALNLIEQVRFAHNKVSREGVLRSLGHVDDQALLAILDAVAFQQPADLLNLLQGIGLDQFSADNVWHRLADVLRIAVWIKHGVQKKNSSLMQNAQLKKIVHGCSWVQLNYFLNSLCSYEGLFTKTTAKHALLEMMLLRMCQHQKKGNDGGMMGGVPLAMADSVPLPEALDNVSQESSEEDVVHGKGTDALTNHWHIFLAQVDAQKDPLVCSVLRQGTARSWDVATGSLTVQFPKKLSFFIDTLQNSQSLLAPVLHTVFGRSVVLNPLFEEISLPTDVSRPVVQRQVLQPVVHEREARIDLSHEAKWPQAALLARYFPGTVSVVKEQ